MKKIFLLSILCSAFILTGCVKPGKGGKAILSVHVFEGACQLAHSNGIPSPNHQVEAEAVIYIKYGSTGVDHDVTSYDDEQIADFGGKTVFEELRRGDYYVYAVSKDGSKTGGTHFEIQNRIGEREVVICTGEY